MKIEVLCSTMYGATPLCLTKGYAPKNIVIINQCVEKSHENQNFLNFYEKGLSKSRNRGVDSSTSSDICLVADNDVYYHDKTFTKIEKAFIDHPDADILTFKVETPEGEPFKDYKESFFWHTKLSIAKVSSVEIAFRRESILKNNIKFDEDFGLGSKFATGEEYIFLNDALSKGLKIAYLPEVIVYHPKESSGGQFDKLSLIQAKGAMIRRIFGIKGYLICWVFSLKKFRYSPYSFYMFLKTILEGFSERK